MSTESANTASNLTLAARIAAVIAGALAASVLAAIAYATGYDSLGKGMIIGASATLLILIGLWAFGGKQSTAARLANGEADEREQLNVTRALADSALAMGAAAIACTIAAMYEMPAELIGGTVLWAGLVTLGISLVIRTRRS